MMEETEQEKKQKKNKNSSKNMIDSFFGSHNLDETQTNKTDRGNFQETEQLIDKIIGNSVSKDEQTKSMKPTVEIVEKQTEHSQNKFNDNIPKGNYKEEEKWNPVVQHNEDEEIFEIDQPKKPSHFEQQKHEPVKQKEKTKSSSEIKQKNKSHKKNSFSIHLPKLNLKFGKNKEKPKEQTNESLPVFKEKKEKEDQTTFNQTIDNTDKSTGRIHGLTQVNETDEHKSTKELEIPKNNPVEPEINQKKSLFKKSKKSFNFFEKKTKEKPIENQTEEQETPKFFKKDFSQKTIESTNQNSSSVTDDEDVLRLLKITDDLLGKLPDEVIEEFSQSEDFALYEKVMKKYDIIQ